MESSASQEVLLSKNIDVEEEGPPVEFCFRETGSSPLIVYATAFGGIVGLGKQIGSFSTVWSTYPFDSGFCNFVMKKKSHKVVFIIK